MRVNDGKRNCAEFDAEVEFTVSEILWRKQESNMCRLFYGGGTDETEKKEGGGGGSIGAEMMAECGGGRERDGEGFGLVWFGDGYNGGGRGKGVD